MLHVSMCDDEIMVIVFAHVFYIKHVGIKSNTANTHLMSVTSAIFTKFMHFYNMKSRV